MLTVKVALTVKIVVLKSVAGRETVLGVNHVTNKRVSKAKTYLATGTRRNRCPKEFCHDGQESVEHREFEMYQRVNRIHQ